MSWSVTEIRGAMHIIPVDDVVDHLAKDCACGPTVEAVFLPGRHIGWMVTHHSLDGREDDE